MSTRISYKTMTDAELIDEGLDHEPGTLAYELAITLDALPINHGSVQIDDEPCGRCSDLDDEILSLETQVYSLETKIENLDMDRLVAGVKRAKEAVKQASDKVNYLLGLGGDHE
mgnify:CR=1 FL=1